jgi:hypothetical protein
MKRMAAVFLTISLLCLTACGTPMYALTDSEEQLIVDYASHVVTKYNKGQSDGLVYVAKQEVTDDSKESTKEDSQSEADMAQTDLQSDADKAQTDTSSDGTDAKTPLENETEQTQAVTLQELLQTEGLDIRWLGVESVESYTASDSVLLTPEQGKEYLIASFSFTDTSAESVTCDFLSKKISYRLLVNGENEIPSETTILVNDLSTFQGDIEPEDTLTLVLLFEKDKEEIAPTDTYALKAKVDGEWKDIALQ